MKYTVAKLFSAKMSGKQVTFRPGEMVELPDSKAARLILAGVITPACSEAMEHEYFILLARFWQIDDDPAATIEEARRLVDRLDALYRELHRKGRNVPVRLPVERNHTETQKGLAL